MSNEKMKYILEEDLIKVNLSADSREELLKELGNLLIEKGYVKHNYTDALLEREIEFPTGILAAGGIGVAIPHTDVKYVNQTALAVGILKKRVPFEYMGYEDGTVKVDIVFVLAIRDAESNLTFLQRFMSIFQNESFMKNLKNLDNAAEIKSVLKSQLDRKEL